ncbi:MAG: hypothetical protein AABX65_04195 [Nanoarchaeota archaeon]
MKMEASTIIGVLTVLAIITIIVWHAKWKRKDRLKWYHLITGD